MKEIKIKKRKKSKDKYELTLEKMEDLRKYRERRFDCKVELSENDDWLKTVYLDDSIIISMTPNGRQWFSLSFLKKTEFQIFMEKLLALCYDENLIQNLIVEDKMPEIEICRE